MTDTNNALSVLPTDVSTVLADSGQFLLTLDDWANAGWLRWLDTEFVVFLHRQMPDATPAVLLAAALTSHQNGHGHACLDLDYCLAEPERALSLPPESPAHQPAVTPQQLLRQLDREQWLRALQHSALIGHNNEPLVMDASSGRPLLYLRRFWHYEQTLARNIQQRLMTPPILDDQQLAATIDMIFDRLSHHNTDNKPALEPAPQLDWQKIACALAARNRFAIITGGPGTGKTTTVVKLLAVLQAMHQHDANQPLRIRLAAPTGKAAARLSTSITSQLTRHGLQGIPGDVSTVHRLLGPIRDSRFFRHHAGNPLPADVVVIDEASMVDIELMALLLEALPAHAKLILLGDKDQLASVEAGAVLGSLCQYAGQARYQPDTAQWITSATGQRVPADYIDSQGSALDQAITMLRYSHRFGQVPGIGKLAAAVNASASADTLNTLFDGRYDELQRLRINSSRDPVFERLISDRTHGYGHFLTVVANPPAHDCDSKTRDNWALQVLKAQGQFQLLVALRKGEFGIEGLNPRIEAILRHHGLLGATPDQPDAIGAAQPSAATWYAGRPVMVTRNDYNLALMNGDIGITLPYPNTAQDGRGTSLRVAFPTADPHQPVRWILPSRLQSVETVFAMTVHKSQGSEFNHTALMLPQHDNPVLTRELIYTGITRAARQFSLIESNAGVLPTAVASSIFRASGLLHAINSMTAAAGHQTG